MTNLHENICAAHEVPTNTNAKMAEHIRGTLSYLLKAEVSGSPSESGLMMVAMYSASIRRNLGLGEEFDSQINVMCNRICEAYGRLVNEPKNEVQSLLADAFSHASQQYERTEKRDEAIF